MNLTNIVSNPVGIIHIIGIGGIGMSGLAKLLHQNGYVVQGSDASDNQHTKSLQELGMHIFLGHNADNVNQSTLVVRSSAIKNDNPEILAAKNKFIPVISRAELLSNMMLDGYNICITGAHGKTSTTSLIYSLLQHLNHSPTVICGGIINQINSNAHKGKSNINIVEADESDCTFLVIPTDIGVITNIDKEHLDYYRSIDNIINMSKIFIEKVLAKDMVVVCDDCQYLRQISANYVGNPKYFTYGINSKTSDVKAFNIQIGIQGFVFDLMLSKKFQQKIGSNFSVIKNIALNNFGVHNLLNALAGITVALFKGGSPDDIKAALLNNSGVKRRFSIIGEVNGVTFVDDYAHHPNEVRATLQMAKARIAQDGGKILAVFQPHRYSRFAELYGEFLHSFKDADRLLVLDVYSAGEAQINGVSSQIFVDEMSSIQEAYYCADDKLMMQLITKHARPGDSVLFMGSGSISEMAHAAVHNCFNRP
ncbi:UDP-N-acetylmuramate--L-alanine ligase [Candidatus Bandiella euplotis]|uniref:UDP-N-acetylmuramate--L-alanine ligase n=1 Tax=Candidatus Bandiella euplotis TaxID=1664265 RepID=A0ABZ0UPB5_9RICK|nr:UDP-N-acetylmuramate--L-alanine ligase [Candidatus Bandiella woodruffii]WPX97096.1 UDP-N-acetylmuramate--L-alanine ligase [Candidatus Bandiella woodruffii]